MLEKTKKNRDLSSYYVIQTYINRIFNQIKSVENMLCPCRVAILKIKWVHWCEWFFMNAHNLHDWELENFEDEIDNLVKKINHEVKSDNDISNVLIDAFNAIHNIALDEFKFIIEVGAHKTDDNMDTIRFVGDSLVLLCQTSVLEMVELNVPCSMLRSEYEEDVRCRFECNNCETCPFHDKIVNKEYNIGAELTVFVNDQFNINSYAEKRLSFLANKVVTDSKEISVIFDFSHYSTFISRKVENMFLVTVDLFKNVKIVNYEDHKAIIPLLEKLGIEFDRLKLVSDERKTPIINNIRIFDKIKTTS